MTVKTVAMLTAGGLAPCLSSAVGGLIERYSEVAPDVRIMAYRNGYAGLLTGDSVEVTSHDGHVWWTGDIHTASALVALFTMLFVTLLALVRVSRSPALH